MIETVMTENTSYDENVAEGIIGNEIEFKLICRNERDNRELTVATMAQFASRCLAVTECT